MKQSVDTSLCTENNASAFSPATEYQTKSAASDVESSEFQNACGQIPYNMTNDYMFRAVLQSNNKVLRGLICSLLHLPEQKVVSVEVTNPVILGEAVTDKEFRLDINVVLNNNTLINLEAKPAAHIGFLDYTLFDDRPEFYASYKLINVKNHQKYSDSLTLHVVATKWNSLKTRWCG